MSARSLHEVVIMILAVTLQVSLATSDVCSDTSCSVTEGTALLNINSRTQKVSPSEIQNDDQDGVASGPARSLLNTKSASKTQAQVLANLDYDSDDGVLLTGRDDSSSSALEFSDDDEVDDAEAADKLHQYTSKMGYYEKNDAVYEPDVWNLSPDIKGSHNCYMYSLNDISPRSAEHCQKTRKRAKDGDLLIAKKEVRKVCKQYFHKPGYYFQNDVSGRDKTDVWFREETTCKLMLPMLAADSPAIIWHNDKNTSLTEADNCPANHYMAALFIMPKLGFHFYRRDHVCEDDPNSLCWSHKPGIMNATNVDASGNKIKVLLDADRDYGHLNYSEHCAFYCVPQNSQARTHSDSTKLSKKKAALLAHKLFK